MPGYTIVKGLPFSPGKLPVKQIGCSFRTVAGHKTHGLHQQAFRVRPGSRQRNCSLASHASTGSFGLDTDGLKEEADNKLHDIPNVCKDLKYVDTHS